MRKRTKIAKQIKQYLKQDDDLYTVNEPICVTTYCGYRDNEHPRSFLWRNRKYEVARAIASWQIEEKNNPKKRVMVYRVETTDGLIFDCRYEEMTERWILVGTELDQDHWPKIEK